MIDLFLDTEMVKCMKRPTSDPAAPPRARSAYLFYANAVRDGIRTEFPQLDIAAITKHIGERWQALSDAEKQPYVEQALHDRERYDAAVQAYRQRILKLSPDASDDAVPDDETAAVAAAAAAETT